MGENITRDECYLKESAMAKKIEEVNQSLTRMEVAMAALPEKLIEKLDQRYATKDVEDEMKWLRRLVLGAVIVALLGLVLKT